MCPNRSESVKIWKRKEWSYGDSNQGIKILVLNNQFVAMWEPLVNNLSLTLISKEIIHH